MVGGSVQGVFFRVGCYEEARRLGVSGWVRNREDGAVEGVFEGAAESVASLIEWCRTGPPGAHVTDVDVVWEQPRSEEGFLITS